MTTTANVPDTMTAPLDERKAGLRDYFSAKGFERWRSIYGTGEVNFIRRTVRTGHAAMVAEALRWVGKAAPLRVLDVGCGPGNVALQLADAGHSVHGIDIAPQMVAHAAAEAANHPHAADLSFAVGDVADVRGTFDVVIALDVLIYYPAAEFGAIIARMGALGAKRLIFTYAPATPLLVAMLRVGRAFPRKTRAPGLVPLARRDLAAALRAAGFHPARSQDYNTGFYHVRLIEAVRV